MFFRLLWNNVDIFMFPLGIFQKIRLFLEPIFFMPDIYVNKTLSCGVLQRINLIWEAKKLMIIGKTNESFEIFLMKCYIKFLNLLWGVVLLQIASQWKMWKCKISENISCFVKDFKKTKHSRSTWKYNVFPFGFWNIRSKKRSTSLIINKLLYLAKTWFENFSKVVILSCTYICIMHEALQHIKTYELWRWPKKARIFYHALKN